MDEVTKSDYTLVYIHSMRGKTSKGPLKFI